MGYFLECSLASFLLLGVVCVCVCVGGGGGGGALNEW